MSPRASVARRPTAREELRAATVSPITPVLRDFSQPWLDLNDRSVLVTGGTGSFGKHFLKTVIAQYKPRRLIIFSRDELKQFEMAQEFPIEKYPFIRYFIGDVRDRDRLDLALRDVDYVIHAAAMKQVPTAEYNPFECIRTNVFGSRGSVVPFFKKLADEGAESLPITDPRMTRFWITLTQGVNFVLSSMEMMRGGEIYVPKIASSTIPQLASLVSPHLKQHVIGIRPGEKLHETMIPVDDAHCTVELEDRYVILQSFATAMRDAYMHRGAKPVAEGFSYSSDTNPEQLDAHGLQNLLQMSYA